MPDRRRLLRQALAVQRRSQVLGRKPGQAVIAARRVQQIGGQGRIKGKAIGRIARVQQTVQQRLAVVAVFGRRGLQKRLQRIPVFRGVYAANTRRCRDSGLGKIVAPRHGAGRSRRRQRGELCQDRCRRCRVDRRVQVVPGHQLDKFQPCKQFTKRRPVRFLAAASFRDKHDGRICPDRRQLVGQKRHFPPGLQLFPQLGADGVVL